MSGRKRGIEADREIQRANITSHTNGSRTQANKSTSYEQPKTGSKTYEYTHNSISEIKSSFIEYIGIVDAVVSTGVSTHHCGTIHTFLQFQCV